MRYCQRCCYPENAQPSIIFDEQGVCSGCRVVESRPSIDWAERERWLVELLDEYKSKAKAARNPYDCIIPVSGGKDSHYQAYLMKVKYGMNPLFVTYNHLYNTKVGLRNLENMFRKFSCDLIRFSTNPDSARRPTSTRSPPGSPRPSRRPPTCASSSPIVTTSSPLPVLPAASS